MAQTATRATQDENGRPAYDSLSSAVGLSLHGYRADHVDGRITRSLEREGLGNADDLIDLVRRDARARERFRRMLAISVTGRFRDPHQFELLSSTVLPDLLTRFDGLRVWSAGCSNGLELLSVAMLLDRAGALERTALLGSDVLAENIEIARAGTVDEIPAPATIAS